MAVQRIEDPAELAAAFALRELVFCREQGVDLAAERDGRDGDAVHLGATDDGDLIGTCRLLAYDGALLVQRVAVRREHRRHGVGAALLGAAAAFAAAAGYRELALDAQVVSREFYERQGYRAEGEPFLEEGIEHIAMRRAVR